MDFANTAPNVLSIVSVGMALAFVLSDRRSMSSRMISFWFWPGEIHVDIISGVAPPATDCILVNCG